LFGLLVRLSKGGSIVAEKLKGFDKLWNDMAVESSATPMGIARNDKTFRREVDNLQAKISMAKYIMNKKKGSKGGKR
jgi:hypothetical protein